MSMDVFLMSVLAGVVLCAIWYGIQKWLEW